MIEAMPNCIPALRAWHSRGARVEETSPDVWRLEIPAGAMGHYRLAQLDDYHSLPRARFPWKPPLRISIRARASAPDLPGTWGFGLWNDPFSLSLGVGGAGQRFPTLPNAVWFFHASPPNYLSFRDDLPAQDFLSATFCSPHLPGWLMALASPLGGMLVIPGAARLARGLLRQVVRQQTRLITTDVTAWHTYELEWALGSVRTWLDGLLILDTPLAPSPPLGLVLWIDNQYAALPPGGILRYGFLPNHEPAWVELSIRLGNG